MRQAWIWTSVPARSPVVSNVAWIARIGWQHNVAGLYGTAYTTGYVEFWTLRTESEVKSCFDMPVAISLVPWDVLDYRSLAMCCSTKAPGTPSCEYDYETVIDSARL